MADYYNICAPQWIDFAQNLSPVQMEDFFKKKHIRHERLEESCSSSTQNVENAPQAAPQEKENIEIIELTPGEKKEYMENAQQSVSQEENVLHVNAKAQADLDIIKNTPVKVISPKYRNNKETIVSKVTYDQVFNDAMRRLDLCKKIPKTRDVLNKSTQEPKIFKTPNMPKLIKSSKSVGCVSNKNNRSDQDSIKRSLKINETSSTCMRKISAFKQTLEKDKDSVENDTFNDPVDDPKGKKEDKQCNEENNEEKDENKYKQEDDNKERNEEDNKKLQNERVKSTDNNNRKKVGNSQDDVDAKINRTQSTKHIAVLTWQHHKRSMYKRRTSVNKQYVGLAEAVSRFQTETPKRFRTKSSKDSARISPSFYSSKLTQNRLKPTIPISPALISKTRTRPVTVLSQEEREMLEIEEMKKYRIKANPIPSNVLRAKANRVAKKQSTNVANTATQQSYEKTKSSFQSKSPHRDLKTSSSGLKNKIPNVIVTDTEGIIVEHEEMAFFGVPKNTTKNVTRIVPFSFEARNKDMQLKREQRLKNLQEASKAKAEFHARPAPSFSSKPSTSSSTRPSTPLAKQQQTAKRMVLPSPFSFEERNKKLSERKEQVMKRILEENKRSRVFRANPAPVFKPVMIRGTSKEHLSFAKNKSMKVEREERNCAEYNKYEDQENKEPNEINSHQTESENTQKIMKNSTISNDNKQKIPLKALSLELNTDKRAKKRREFDDKLKHKEMEEETKRQTQEKQQLEHEKQMQMELRKLAEIKARPMPKYKPPVIVKATKLLTNPQSPAFASKLIARSKQT